MTEDSEDGAKACVRDGVEDGGERGGIGVLPLFWKVAPDYADCPRHPSAKFSWVSGEGKFVGGKKRGEGSG